jgi:flagellar hook-basal body complex protein FliE
MVDYSTVENEYLTPIIRSFNENLESAQNTAQEEAEKFKKFFLKQLDDLQSALKKKVEENEKLTQNQSSIDAVIESEREKVAWLENFMVRLDRILEI